MSTPAGIRTRVRALATPGDNHYTTGVYSIPIPGAQTRTRTGDNCLFRAALSQTELPGHCKQHIVNVFAFIVIGLWWARGESNSGPPPCQGDVITS